MKSDIQGVRTIKFRQGFLKQNIKPLPSLGEICIYSIPFPDGTCSCQQCEDDKFYFMDIDITYENITDTLKITSIYFKTDGDMADYIKNNQEDNEETSAYLSRTIYERILNEVKAHISSSKKKD